MKQCSSQHAATNFQSKGAWPVLLACLMQANTQLEPFLIPLSDGALASSLRQSEIILHLHACSHIPSQLVSALLPWWHICPASSCARPV